MNTQPAQIQNTEKAECPNCMGRGWCGAYSIHKTCETCRGAGEVTANEKQERVNLKL